MEYTFKPKLQGYEFEIQYEYISKTYSIKIISEEYTTAIRRLKRNYYPNQIRILSCVCTCKVT